MQWTINDKILAVVAHPDDETLGAGGTLAKFSQSGVSVFAMCMTDGVSARFTVKEVDRVTRKKAALGASQVLGFEWLFFGNLPDNELDQVSLLKIIKTVEEIKSKIKPTIVITHSPSDLNVDHRVVSHAVLTAFRPVPGEVLSEIIFMEVPSATDYGHPDMFGNFKPNYYIDIELEWSKKIQALEVYKDEIYDSPHSRSISGIDALSILRGHQVGINRAEAFQIIRKIIR